MKAWFGSGFEDFSVPWGVQLVSVIINRQESATVVAPANFPVLSLMYCRASPVELLELAEVKSRFPQLKIVT